MSIISNFLDSTILFSFDRLGFARHAKQFKNENWNENKKVIVITGGNSGIGFTLANAFLKNHHEVHILCRSNTRGTAALEKLQKAHPSSNITLHIVDLSCRKSIHSWVTNAAPTKIDVLVNNAGGLSSKLKHTEDGHEITWATHLHGPYFLTSKLLELDSLKKGSRVIMVTSGGMYLKKIDLSDPNFTKQKYNKYTSYANAKKAQAILTKLWNEKFGPDIVFSCMHPGWVNTNAVSKGMPFFYKFTKKLLRTPEQGADTIFWLALTKQEYKGGKLWFDRQEAPMNKFKFAKESNNEHEQLWKHLSSL